MVLDNMLWDQFIEAGVLVFSFMGIMFLIASLIKDNSIADIGWGLGFCIVAVFTLLKHEIYIPRTLLISSLTIIWGLRLALYIFIRNRGKGEDYRYVNMRKNWGDRVLFNAFSRVFMLQGFLLLLISLPIIFTNSTDSQSTDLGVFEILGSTLWIFGFLFESVGDWQLFRFKANPANKGKIMDQGLWRYTRHPNYFGESLIWWGIYLISIPAGNFFVSLISPVLITFLLLKVSGVALLEKKYEKNDRYYEYKRKTSPFIPRLPKQ